MLSQKIKPTDIESYIDAAPQDTQQKLHQLNACIREAAPGATAGLKWGMPAYSYQKILVTFAAFKHHIGFYPMETAIKKFAGKLAKYPTSKGSIQFPLGKPLPLGLIRKIVQFRLKESNEGIIKWRS